MEKKIVKEKTVEEILREYINKKYTGKDASLLTIEEKGKKIKKIIFSTTQLRLLLSNAVVVKNKISMEKNENAELSENIQNEIKYLLIKHIYQCGRETEVKEFDKEFKISEKIKKIGNSEKKFNDFYRYLEEIVAYMKYYID
jgi:CRISPR type III-A/MTUBE-associated protein Csm2